VHSAPTRRGRTSKNAEVDKWFASWYERRDVLARDRIVEEYMPLARSLVRRYTRSSEPTEDLLQVAALALVKAVNRFEVDRGVSFSAYAIPTILGELRRYFRDSGWALHVPRRDKELARAIGEAESELTHAAGRAPSVQRMAEYLEIDVERVLDGLRAAAAYATVGLEEADPQEEHGGGSRETHGAVDPAYAQIEERIVLAGALRTLAERDRELLRMRFGEELTQAEIGRRIGVSQMQASRLLRRCLAALGDGVREGTAVDATPSPRGGSGCQRRGAQTRAGITSSASRSSCL
jgi:RNA polymerase sigma-B factor